VHIVVERISIVAWSELLVCSILESIQKIYFFLMFLEVFFDTWFQFWVPGELFTCAISVLELAPAID
jgi:hypothetical protein